MLYWKTSRDVGRRESAEGDAYLSVVGGEEESVRSARRRTNAWRRLEWSLATALVASRDFLERIIVDISVESAFLYIMLPRSLWASRDICLRCQWRIASSSKSGSLLQTCRNSNSVIKVPRALSGRALHTSALVGLRHAFFLAANMTDTLSAHNRSIPRPPSIPLSTPSLSPDPQKCQFATTSVSGKTSTAALARIPCLLSRSTRSMARSSTISPRLQMHRQQSP